MLPRSGGGGMINSGGRASPEVESPSSALSPTGMIAGRSKNCPWVTTRKDYLKPAEERKT